MFTSLRARLWITYAILILLILSILAVGVFVYIIRNPIIDRQAMIQLNAVQEIIQRQLTERRAAIQNELVYLKRISESLEVRLILFSPERKVVFDSDRDSPIISWPEGSTPPESNGRIEDQTGDIWLYNSMIFPKGDILVLALPREDFIPAFAQVGLVAFLLAVVFAAWMGSWIVNPLDDIKEASQSISSGKYQKINLKGPDEVRTLAEAFNDMVDRVQLTQKSQRDFVANVSHELKTPLTSIQGFSQAIQDGTVETGPALKKAAGIIKTEADRMFRLVVDLLDLARFDAGTVELDRRALDLSGLLSHVVNQLIPQASQAAVDLNLDVDTLPTCVGDEDRLAQVFTNLVDNAIKHAPEGGFVNLSARVEGDFARIEIIDNGPGIPADQLERIFEQIYKIDGSRKENSKPGTGLGLAIAHQIVQAHSGIIHVRSSVGEGAAFEVRLPVVKSDDLTVVEPI